VSPARREPRPPPPPDDDLTTSPSYLLLPPAPVRTREGRLKAAQNLVHFGIDCLAVCGGDGSLTGADMLRKEWPSLVKELLENKRITKVQAETYGHLNIVGLVGSIE